MPSEPGEMTGSVESPAANSVASRRHPGLPVAREFLREQLPLFLIVMACGVGAALLQHGFVPGADQPFPLAGVAVPVWHLVWMGFWTGASLGLVGGAAGLFALPYSISALGFAAINVTPTIQLMTLVNPLGALFGFHRSRQSNLDFALWTCLGAVGGGLLGPFIRLTLLADPAPFQVFMGLSLAVLGIYLLWLAVQSFRTRSETPETGAVSRPVSSDDHIRTLSRGPAGLVFACDGVTWTVRRTSLFLLGATTGVVSTTLGVGGAFLLVPALVIIYRMPMSVVVAASIPYVIVLSGIGLASYCIVLPAMTGEAIPPEWSWGLFAAAGGILGSWAAAKSQRFFPDFLLQGFLGAATTALSAGYISGFLR